MLSLFGNGRSEYDLSVSHIGKKFKSQLLPFSQLFHINSKYFLYPSAILSLIITTTKGSSPQYIDATLFPKISIEHVEVNPLGKT